LTILSATDFATLEAHLEFLMHQMAQLPTYKELAKMALPFRGAVENGQAAENWLGENRLNPSISTIRLLG
jgi:hypothetical protein